MITGIVLLVVGIACVVACRAYVREPVLRTVGVIVGIILALVGGYFLLVALLGGLDAPDGAELDSAPAVLLR